MGRVKSELFTNKYILDQECEMENSRYKKKANNEKIMPTLEESNLTEIAYILNEKDYADKLLKAETDAENISSRRTDKYLQLIQECECLCSAKLLIPFPEDVIDKLKKLKLKFPHATEFVDNIIANVYLQYFSSKPFAKIPPTLLYGPAGTGKSKLAKEVSKILAPEVYYLNLAVAPEAFFLVGLTLSYDSGDIGQIAKILKSKYGNVFVVIEEIDKAIGIKNQQKTSPMVPLLELLEHDNLSDPCVEMNLKYRQFQLNLTLLK